MDCKWSEWQIGNCSMTCGPEGTRTNTRTKTVKEKNGGKKCEGEATKEESCNTEVKCSGNIVFYWIFQYILHFVLYASFKINCYDGTN